MAGVGIREERYVLRYVLGVFWFSDSDLFGQVSRAWQLHLWAVPLGVAPRLWNLSCALGQYLYSSIGCVDSVLFWPFRFLIDIWLREMAHYWFNLVSHSVVYLKSRTRHYIKSTFLRLHDGSLFLSLLFTQEGLLPSGSVLPCTSHDLGALHGDGPAYSAIRRRLVYSTN